MKRSVVIIAGAVALLVGAGAGRGAPPRPPFGPSDEEVAKRWRVLHEMDEQLQERLRNEEVDAEWAPAMERTLRGDLARVPRGKAVRVTCRATLCLLSIPKTKAPDEDAVLGIINKQGRALSETYFVRNSSTTMLERTWSARVGTKLFPGGPVRSAPTSY